MDRRRARGGAALLALDLDPDASAPPIVETAAPRRPGWTSSPSCRPRSAPTLRLEAGEAEHRQVTAAFVKFTGVEALLAKGGPEALSEPLASSARPSAG